MSDLTLRDHGVRDLAACTPSSDVASSATASGGARTRATLIPDDPDVNETER